jgi:hypothetical protein
MTMAVLKRLARAGVVLASAAVLASCQLATHPITTNGYGPSDGIRVVVADGINVENLLVVTEAEGETGYVVGSIVNNTGTDATVLLDIGETGNPSPFEVPARGNINLTESDMTVEAVDAAPGATIPTEIQGPDGFNEVRATPVLDGTLPEYAEFLETATAP